MTRIILNADDFGLAPGINQSIVELNRAGALTSATLMATAAYTAPAAAETTATSGLSIGCHIVLVDGRPAVPRASIPALALASGSFRPSLGSFVRDLMLGRIPESQIEDEATAQIRHLQSLGVRIAHLDTHKHTHIFPRVLRPLLRAALGCGVRAIRNPFEPDWALKATRRAPASRQVQIRLLRTQQREFLKLVKQAGLATSDGAVGVLATGTLNAETLSCLLNAMPNGTWEVVCHPGYVDADLQRANTRLRESRAIEHAALLEVVPRFLRDHPEIAAINFSQLRETIA